MKRLWIIPLGLVVAGLAYAQDIDPDSERERQQPRTGTRILDRIEIVFDTAPIRLGAALALASAATSPVAEEAEPGRPSVSFILDQGLELAPQVFRTHPGFSTDEVVVDVRSLEQVRRHLEQAESPWGVINLVAHGAPQTGLNVPIRPEGPRASTAQLALEPQRLSQAAPTIDAHTRIRVYGCGVGADPELLKGLERFFTVRADHTPQVTALKEFVEFTDTPSLGVALRETLTAIAPGRMEARRRIERMAARLGQTLVSGWEREFDTKPLEVELIVRDGDGDAGALAATSPQIQAELDRLGARLDDFEWSLKDGLLRGEAVLGYLPLKPPSDRRSLAHADQAEWIASR